MGSETPCCGGGLSGICLLIIHFIFQFLTTSTSNVFQFFPLNFYTLKKFEKLSKNSQKLLNQGLQLNRVII